MTIVNKSVVPAQEPAHAVSSSTRAESVAWDPYEVWLKRVKQPREHEIPPASRVGPVVATRPRDLRPLWPRLKPHA
jgi:hypothetical protein